MGSFMKKNWSSMLRATNYLISDIKDEMVNLVRDISNEPYNATEFAVGAQTLDVVNEAIAGIFDMSDYAVFVVTMISLL